MALPLWPTLVDDSGTFRDGTEVNKALFDDVHDAIVDEVQDSAYPTVQVKDLIGEVVGARGSLSTLDDRLDVSLNDDGTLKSVAGQATTSELAADVGAINLWMDSGHLLWPDGDSSAPWDTTLGGTGAAILRCGSGLSDTTALKDAKWTVRLSYGSTAVKLTRTIVSAAQIAILQGLVGKKVCVGARCKASVMNAARIVVDDGVGQTYGGESGNSSYHSGDGNDNRIYVEHTVNSGATKIDVYYENVQTGNAYFGAPTVTVSSYAAATYRPDRWAPNEIDVVLLDAIAIGDGQNNIGWRFDVPALYMGLSGAVGTAPVGAAMIFDVEFDSDAAFGSAVSPYSTLPDIDDGDVEIDDGALTVPDGTYANRCLVPGDYARFNVDQVGSGTAGSDLTGKLTFISPLSPWLAMGLGLL